MPTIASDMRQALREVDPQLPFNKFRSLDEVRGEAVLVARIQAALLGALAGIALLLCALGVGGLVGRSVTERRREFGVRIALGATSSEIVRAATTPAVALALGGAVIGLAFSLAGARVLNGLVFGVSVRDPVTFGGAAAIVIGTGLLAAILPALRTLRVDVAAVLSGR
jgi:ABC-type antimicrobial peptide transport system permease subunit